MEFTFTGPHLALRDGKRPWHFATPPQAAARQIRTLQVPAKPSGSIRVTAIIGNSRWKTSIFRDNKTESYFLPVKEPSAPLNTSAPEIPSLLL